MNPHNANVEKVARTSRPDCALNILAQARRLYKPPKLLQNTGRRKVAKELPSVIWSGSVCAACDRQIKTIAIILNNSTPDERSGLETLTSPDIAAFSPLRIM